METHGKIVYAYGEAIAYMCKNALECVTQLIIDDGIPDRGHRQNILSKDYKMFGCHSAPHRDFEDMHCLDFAGDYIPKD